jgi:trehalose synthase
MDNLAQIQAFYNKDTSSLRRRYQPFYNLKINMISAGSYGSGVSESTGALNTYFNELGLKSFWQVLKGGEDFLSLSKHLANSFCSLNTKANKSDLEAFERHSSALRIDADCDILYVHDHHGLIAASKIKGIKKIYRCHFDVSCASQDIWDFFRPYMESFDAVIFSSPQFHKPLNANLFYILPSINPLSVKNTFVPRPAALDVLQSFGIPADRPIISQVSRFDRLKDPFGVIDTFNIVRKEALCRLIFAGGHAQDDSESRQVYEEVKKKANGDKDIFILAIDKQDYNIAAIQSLSDVIIQKSLSESFGLAITEALWKNKPVVASDIGGIKFQIKDEQTGLLCKDIPSCAQAVLRLLKDKALAKKLGTNGHNLVKEEFLITAELQKHLEIFKKILQ